MHQHALFVYGTLKRGEPNHHWLLDDKGKATFIGEGTMTVKYPLVIASRYNIPFLLDVPGTGKLIRGELYSIDDKKLKHLDVLEEYPRLYTRRKERVVIADKGEDVEERSIEAITYFLIKHKKDMMELDFISSYSSTGPHGKEYNRHEDIVAPEDI